MQAGPLQRALSPCCYFGHSAPPWRTSHDSFGEVLACSPPIPYSRLDGIFVSGATQTRSAPYRNGLAGFGLPQSDLMPSFSSTNSRSVVGERKEAGEEGLLYPGDGVLWRVHVRLISAVALKPRCFPSSPSKNNAQPSLHADVSHP